MEKKGQAAQRGGFLSGFGRAFTQVKKVFLFLSLLTFSAADERLLPRKTLFISIEKGATDAVLASFFGFLSRTKVLKSKRSDFEKETYPEPADVVAAARAVTEGPGRRSATLALPEDWIIQRVADFPSAIKRNIADAVSYELDRLVPIEPAGMFYDWSVIREDGRVLTLKVAAVKIEKVKPYIDCLRANGIDITKVVYLEETVDGNGKLASAIKIPGKAAGARQAVLEALSPDPKRLNLLNNGRRETSKAPVAASILFAVLLAAIWAYHISKPLKLEADRIEALDQQISMEKRKSSALGPVLKQTGFINGEIAAINNFDLQRPMALRALKELTAAIPKSAWLTNFKFSGTSVQIEGYAASAPGLIPRLERSGHFKKVEFAAATLRDAKTRADHFIIKMEFSPADTPPQANRNGTLFSKGREVKE